MTRPGRRLLWCLAILALLATGAAQARVFWRWKADSSRQAMAAIGGAAIYQAAVEINGGQGELTVYGSDRPLRVLTDDLSHLYGIPFLAGPGATMALAEGTHDDRRLRLVVLRLSEADKTLVFEWTQSQKEATASSRPTRHLLTEVPEYPDSQPVFFARDLKAGATLAIARTDASAADVQTFYHTSLLAAGWADALPARTAMKLYLRGNDLCAVLAEDSNVEGRRITVLHKRQGVK